MSTANENKAAESPRYRLTELAYIDDKLLSEGTEIQFEGIPGYHMVPLNDAAKAMHKKHGKGFVDPIEAMTVIS